MFNYNHCANAIVHLQTWNNKKKSETLKEIVFCVVLHFPQISLIDIGHSMTSAYDSSNFIQFGWKFYYRISESTSHNLFCSFSFLMYQFRVIVFWKLKTAFSALKKLVFHFESPTTLGWYIRKGKRPKNIVRYTLKYLWYNF